jgi:hypothetical protein
VSQVAVAVPARNDMVLLLLLLLVVLQKEGVDTERAFRGGW